MLKINNKGQSLVMFVLIIPIFLLILTLVYDVGNAIYEKDILSNTNYLTIEYGLNNIDTVTEKLVQKGIEKLLHGRTSFVVAHRLSTIRDCDKIMVINNGKIEEEGNHEELLKLRGNYYELYMAQYNFMNQ